MAQVWLSLGSNQDRTNNIETAIKRLLYKYGELIISPIYESPAVGFDGDDFYNLVVGISTKLTVLELHQQLREIEDEQGRIRNTEKFSPRTLDIDLLIYDSEIIKTETIEVPRGEITQYAFVLKPLADVAPNETHPETGETFYAIWKDFQLNNDIDISFVDMNQFDFS